MATRVADIQKIYDEHIRALSAEHRLKMLALIADDLAAEGLPKPIERKYSLLDLYGAGVGVWEGMDAQEYVNQMRDEWDERPQ